MSTESRFDDMCYELLKLIPKGKVTTYAEMAKALNTRAWRAVGSAMARNEQLITIPCHRVIRSDGSIGLYALGSEKKAELLIQEGVDVCNGKVKNLQKFFHRFD